MTASVVLVALASLLGAASLLDLALAVGGRQRPRRSSDAMPVRRWTRDGPERIERLLDAAGRQEVPDAAALAARCRIGALVGGTWGGALALLLGGPLAALAAGAAGAAVGRRIPELLLRSAARRRAHRLADAAPEVLDLLAIAMAGGLPIPAALAAVSHWLDGDLAVAAGRAAGDAAGGASVERVLDRFSATNPADEIAAAAAILLRSRRHGTPAAPALGALAVESRRARARRAGEHAARAVPRIQLVAALLLVPAALCILAAGVLAGGLV